MKLKTFLTIVAIIYMVFGIGLVLIPGTFVSMFGLKLIPPGLLMGRLFGAVNLCIGLVC